MNVVFGVIVGLLVLMLLVIAHELGHFIMARRNGVNVLEFGIGFPPRALAWVKDKKTGKWKRIPRADWKKPQDSLILSLNWLPIGGFCQMDGESAADTWKGTFGAASFWKKTKILFGGVIANWLVAFVILTILAWTGMPQFFANQFTVPIDTTIDRAPVEVSSILEDSPAARAGFMVGDKIKRIDGNEVWSSDEILSYNRDHAGENTVYTISRMLYICRPDKVECIDEEKLQESIEKELEVKLNPADAEYLLGITMTNEMARSYSTWSAPIVGAGLTVQVTGETIKGVGQIIGNLVGGTLSQLNFDSEVRDAGRESISEVGDSVSGPIGIIGVLFPSFTAAGLTSLAFLTAVISISLACMNILPIPALDGGRWLLIAIYKLRKKTLTKETEEKIVSRAFMVLLALMFIVTILDVVRIVR